MRKISEAWIIYHFLKRYYDGKSIRYKDIRNEDPLLIYRIEKRFKNIKNLCNMLNIEHNYYKKEPLTEQEIIERLNYLKQIGRLTTNAMRTEFNDLRLEKALIRKFGSVNNALEYYNLERDLVVWDKEKIKNKIEKYYNEGINLNYTNMIHIDPALVSAATSHFDLGWNELINLLGFNYIPSRRKFSKDFILEQVKKFYEEGNIINTSNLRSYDSALLFGIYQYFGSIENVILELGLNPLDHLTINNIQNLGTMFEKIVKQIIDKLKIKYKYNKVIKVDGKSIRPDFQFKNKIWADCKISSWTAFHDGTFEKYLPYCKKLKIIYLRGNHISNVPHKVELIHVSKLYNLLEEKDKNKIIKKLDGIIYEISNITNSA